LFRSLKAKQGADAFGPELFALDGYHRTARGQQAVDRPEGFHCNPGHQQPSTQPQTQQKACDAPVMHGYRFYRRPPAGYGEFPYHSIKVFQPAVDYWSERGSMPLLETKHFGKISYEPESELDFPCGLPGFEDRKRFVAVHFVENDPLIYLQSLEDPALCFITMPILAADPQYRLKVSGEDLGHLGLSPGRQPRIGDDVLCLTVLSLRETGPTANLLAPIVVNLRNRKAVQAVAPESDYTHQFDLIPQEVQPQEAAVC
jgi:flagellar assembly factor FliW